jgi:glycosyltransferase involved in cell wall biosynthesis
MSAAAGSPKCSILIASKDRRPDLDRAIGSVLRQDFKDWELIVCDDGSDPAYASSADFTLLRNNVPRGAAETRNILAKAANAPVLFFLDDDAVLDDPSTLRRAVETTRPDALIALKHIMHRESPIIGNREAKQKLRRR